METQFSPEVRLLMRRVLGAAAVAAAMAAAAILVVAVLLAGCTEDDGVSAAPHPPGDPGDPRLPGAPKGFPRLPYPEGNPPTAARIELGRHLFFDTRLSRDATVSCGSCHNPAGAFADPGKAVSVGIEGRRTPRNSPSLANAAYGTSFFAEGGAPTLELQAIAPIINPLEMDMDTDSLVARISAIPLYRTLFREAWGDDTLDFGRVTKSIASFERALLSGDSPYDRWIHGDARALSAGAVRGVKLFFGEKADCFHCHGGFNFTDQGFHNTGLDPVTTDPGRMAVTERPLDEGKFKTPSLRNIALTAPYMHDGRFATLRQAVDHYNAGGKGHPNRDALMRPLGLSEEDIQDLIAFLESLTDTAFAGNPGFSNPWTP